MKDKIRPISLITLAIGAALIIAGIATGQNLDVLYKAIMICFECVGIG